MWPFSRSQRDRFESAVKRDEFEDLVRRVKLVERENDDLHAAYRRLRSAKAVEARETRSDPPPAGDQPQRRKDQLRLALLKRAHGPAE